MNNTIKRIKLYVLGIVFLFNAGSGVFASKTDFMLWMTKKNYFFDHKAPAQYLSSYDGLRFIKGRIKAIEDSNGDLL